MIKIIVSGIVIAIFAFVINLLVYLGAFKTVEITEGDEPALIYLYKDHFGAYHKIVTIIEEVEKWAKSQGIDCSKSFGQYLDNPDTVDEDRRRSLGGCVVSFVPEDLPPEFKVKQIPAQRYVKAVFEGSPSIGPTKVYSKVRSYAQDKRLSLESAVTEIYVIKSEKEMITTYLFPIN